MPPRKKKVVEPVTAPVVVAEKPKRQIENKPDHVNFYSYCQHLIRIEKLDPAVQVHADVIKWVLKKIPLNDDTKHPVVYQLKLARNKPLEFVHSFEIMNLELDPELQKMVDQINSKGSKQPEDQ